MFKDNGWILKLLLIIRMQICPIRPKNVIKVIDVGIEIYAQYGKPDEA